MPESKKREKLAAMDAAVGALATVGVFAVYYLRNHDVVGRAVSEGGALALLFGFVAVVVVGGLGGLWAAVHHPKDLKTAFSIGLGLPALIFAVDLGTVRSGEAKQAGILPVAFLDPSTAFGRGVSLILRPVDSVREEATERGVEEGTEKTRAEANVAMEALAVQHTKDVEIWKAEAESLSRQLPSGAARLDPTLYKKTLDNFDAVRLQKWKHGAVKAGPR